jgi:hypothetical protein
MFEFYYAEGIPLGQLRGFEVPLIKGVARRAGGFL